VRPRLPPSVRARLRPFKQRAVRTCTPALLPRWTALPRRTAPVSRGYGYDRGTPIDRHYIDDFLWRHGPAPGYGIGDIRGHVVEVGGNEYATRYGAAVTRLDVLHVSAANRLATVVGDLTDGTGIPSSTWDCVICTQTLQVVFDVRAAIATLHRMLRPGGVALVTTAGISSACKPDRDLWGDYWRFTSRSIRMLFDEAFPPAAVTVEAYGNVLSTAAFLYGLAAEELRPRELDCRDPDYELLLAVRARKAL
jgi:SAM-dependent methyltransferase